LKNIGWKLKQVLLPGGNTKYLLKDWDLWGPLLLCLALSIRLSLSSSSTEKDAVFAYSFAIVWCGAAVVTLNSKLLGGKLSFFQSICVLGYCICPLVLASFLTIPLGLLPNLVYGFLKLACISASYVWSVYSSGGFLTDTNLEKRKILAIYPIYFFYFVLAWLVGSLLYYFF
jgi:hypothetical protein